MNIYGWFKKMVGINRSKKPINRRPRPDNEEIRSLFRRRTSKARKGVAYRVLTSNVRRRGPYGRKLSKRLAVIHLEKMKAKREKKVA